MEKFQHWEDKNSQECTLSTNIVKTANYQVMQQPFFKTKTLLKNCGQNYHLNFCFLLFSLRVRKSYFLKNPPDKGKILRKLSKPC